MIKIYCSDKNLPEKKYLFDVIFNEFLGISCEVITRPGEENYVLELDNGNEIIIEDHFWNKIQGDELSYLNHKFLPVNVEYSKNRFTSEADIPVLYGNPSLKEDLNKLICSIDIFASIYFFLSRWEEFISKEKDFAGRFQYKHSVSCRFNLVHRPVVNELVEMLWSMLLAYGYKGQRKMHQFNPVISHDIDQPVRLSSLKMLMKATGKTLIRHKNIPDALYYFVVYPVNKITPRYDLANSYDFLMDVSDSIGIQSYFNFQSSEKTNYDWGYNTNSRFVNSVFKRIKSRNHVIGFHPGFYTLDNPVLWKSEYEKLCDIAGLKVLHGRQHYLRFNAPFTWQMWEDNGLSSDSTLGYAEQEGFRCGTCYEYSTFNFLTRKKMNLKERPLLLMDVTLMGYQNFSSKETFSDRFNSIYRIVKKYQGNFVFLWHNSAFDRTIYTRDFYKELITSLVN